jgi:hypothetical protein
LAADNKFTLALPISQVDDYFFYHTASCTFSAEYMTTVVMVPIKKLTSNWHVYNVHNIAFQTQIGEVCSFTDIPSVVAVDETSHKIFPFSDSDLEKCNPYSANDLCFIGQYESSFYPYKNASKPCTSNPTLKT